MKEIVLKANSAGFAIGGHPWVFAGAIEAPKESLKDGEEVVVVEPRDRRFVGYGVWNSVSDIRVRLYSWNKEEPVNTALLKKRIHDALLYREALYGPRTATDARREIFSEADGLSGLTADRYGDSWVLQVTSRALWDRLEAICEIVRALASPRCLISQVSRGIAEKEGLISGEPLVWGESDAGGIDILEGKVRFRVDLLGGQKTGHFLDQRENRQAAAPFAKGRKVLDLHSYTGGFGLHCAKAGASSVICVDSSAAAVEKCKENALRNELASVEAVRADVFDYAKRSPSGSFEMVILDPPRLAPNRSAKERALRTYFRLNDEALRLLAPGGILVTSSCSGQITSTDLLALLSSVARKARRPLRAIEVRGAARDHPVLLNCPETQYLKCVIAQAGA